MKPQLTEREIKELMMPGTYVPRKHTKRPKVHHRPRLRASMSEAFARSEWGKTK